MILEEIKKIDDLENTQLRFKDKCDNVLDSVTIEKYNEFEENLFKSNNYFKLYSCDEVMSIFKMNNSKLNEVNENKVIYITGKELFEKCSNKFSRI